MFIFALAVHILFFEFLPRLLNTYYKKRILLILLPSYKIPFALAKPILFLENIKSMEKDIDEQHEASEEEIYAEVGMLGREHLVPLFVMFHKIAAGRDLVDIATDMALAATFVGTVDLHADLIRSGRMETTGAVTFFALDTAESPGADQAVVAFLIAGISVGGHVAGATIVREILTVVIADPALGGQVILYLSAGDNGA